MSEITKTKATDLNKANRALVEQLANETDAVKQSELFNSYLRSQAAFWNYSWHNQMHIYRQRPDASFVAGFNSWIKCGRFVRKGEKGIAILAPMFFKDKAKAEIDPETGIRIWFKVVYVFDIAQTDGAELPELPTKSIGERGDDMLARLLTFAASEGFKVDFVETCAIRGAQGTSKGSEIQISSGLDIATQAATLAHEIAHSILHWTKDGTKLTSRDGKTLDRQQRELEAEATAYVVCNYFGVQPPSDFYLATYKVTSALLLEAIETISQTAKKILEGCQKSESAPSPALAMVPAVVISTVSSELVAVAA